MTGIHLPDLRQHVVQPVLRYLDLYSPAAENLLVGTAITESRLAYLHQIGGGPAEGIYQMESATEDDIWDNYLRYNLVLRDKVEKMLTPAAFDVEMVGNLYYATAMCRLHYRRVPAPLPEPDDARGLAAYWKRYYNTPLGAGTVEKAIPAFQRACGQV